MAAEDARWQQTVATRYPGGGCSEAFGVRSGWDQGRVACYVNTNDDAVITYDYADRPLRVTAIDLSGDTAGLYAWWEGDEGSGVPLR